MLLTAPLKVILVVLAPLHPAWLATGTTVGAGFTVIVKSCGAPVHPFAEGVTVTVAVSILPVLFAAIKEAMFPVPVEVRPIVALVFVHE